MVSETQQDILAIHGYRIVASSRGEEEGACSVEYPNQRPDAFMKRFSRDVFSNPELAWEHAWHDYNTGNFNIGR